MGSSDATLYAGRQQPHRRCPGSRSASIDHEPKNAPILCISVTGRETLASRPSASTPGVQSTLRDAGALVRRRLRRLLLTAASARRAKPGVRVLGFHLMPPPDLFRAQVAAIRRVARIIDEAELIAELDAGAVTDAESRVVLTFDDGYESCVDDTALSLIDELSLRPTLFVVAAAVDPELGTPRRLLCDASGTSYRLASPAQLRRAAGAGWFVGSHTSTHWDCAIGSQEDLEREIVGSKAALATALGVPIRTFAFPFGRASNLSRSAVEIVANSGYDAGFTTRRGLVTSHSAASRHRLPRDVVESWWGAKEVSGCLAGILDHVPVTR